MNLYKILPDTKRNPTSFYMLVERRTGNLVEYFDDMREAMRCSKFMSSGGAFNGFTPRFICWKSLPEHEDIPPVSVVQKEQEDLDQKFRKKVLRP